MEQLKVDSQLGVIHDLCLKGDSSDYFTSSKNVLNSASTKSKVSFTNEIIPLVLPYHELL